MIEDILSENIIEDILNPSEKQKENKDSFDSQEILKDKNRRVRKQIITIYDEIVDV